MPDARLVTDVRGMLGFTGTVDGKPLSVLGSGMGMPSITIYAHELFAQFGVQRIIRVGTAGGISPQVGLGDVIVAVGAHTDSNMNQQRLAGLHFSAVASFELVRAAADAAVAGALDGQPVHVGMIMSHDHFYLPNSDPGWLPRLAQYGVLGVEMGAAALFGVVDECGKQALAVPTVSHLLFDPAAQMNSNARETRFAGALRLALAAAHC